MRTQMADPLVSCQLGLAEDGGVVVIVKAQGAGEELELQFTDLHYLAGVVNLLMTAGERALRVPAEGWEAIVSEFAADDASAGVVDDELIRRLLEE